MLFSSRFLRVLCVGFLAILFALPGVALAEEDSPFGGSVVYPEPTPETDTAWRLTDGDPNSRMTFEKGETLTLAWSGAPAALYLEWYVPPISVQIDLCSASGAILETRTIADGLYASLISLPENAAGAVLTASGTEPAATPVPYAATKLRKPKKTTLALSEYRLLDADEAAACALPETPEKTDLMLVAAHTGDEFCYFGSVLPTYAGEQCMQTVTVFLSHADRLAQREAMAAQRLCGVSSQPVFLGLHYRFLEQEYAGDAKAFWPEADALPGLVAAIRQYRPEVIVTNDPAGERSDGLHAWTAALTTKAAALAADEKQYPDSAALYGAWQVKKIYAHSDGGTTELPASTPLNAFSGRTADEVAAEAFACYTRFALYQPEVSLSPRFTLLETQVGEDDGADGLFAHIDETTLTNVNAVLPTPSPAPTPEPTATPAPVPVAATAAEPEPLAWFSRSLVTLGLGMAVSTILAVFLLLLRGKRTEQDGERRPHRGTLRIVLCLLPLLVCSALAMMQTPLVQKRLAALGLGGLSVTTAAMPAANEPARDGAPGAASGESAPDTAADDGGDPAEAALADGEPADDGAPEATPDAEAAENASSDPAAADSAASSIDASYFLAYDDPAGEYVSADADAGHWEYRSSTLSVIIDQHENDTPLVWYVAHIRMRDVDAFRPGFGYYDERGSAKEAPYLLSRRYRAVLAITGDNLINDEYRIKGVLIRNGRLYSEAQAQDTMALMPDLSMKIYPRKAFTAQDILEDGVQNTFGFGPTLVLNGEIGAKITQHRAKGHNPRSGLGMVEPGHFVAIVVDGRQKDYSVGVRIQEYAQMFIDEGCTVAYNMDGGISAGIVFMGENLNQHRSARLKHTSSQRPWPDALLWGYSDLVPLMTDPVYNTGNKDETEALNATPTPLPTETAAATPAATAKSPAAAAAGK